ncbi:MAG: cobalt ECF transporter T component CbiQ [Thermodesulfovibrionales bacterium]|nr:cobalt ECF transporter T component CbiQ [Thermodesulfovibrionales bacterium]
MHLLLGEFKKEHILFSFDARIKILVSIFSLILTISYNGFIFPLLILSLCTAYFISIRVPLRTILIRYSEPLFISSVLLLLKFFFSGKESLFSLDLKLFTLVGYKDGFIDGLILALRILSGVSIIIALELSTPFTEIMASLSWFRIPKTFIEIMMFTYRYIFVLLEDAIVIYNSQKNRLGYSSFKVSLSSFSTLVGTLIIKAFDHSQKTTTAMMLRGYDGKMPFLGHSKFKKKEIIASVVFMIALILLWKI